MFAIDIVQTLFLCIFFFPLQIPAFYFYMKVERQLNVWMLSRNFNLELSLWLLIILCLSLIGQREREKRVYGKGCSSKLPVILLAEAKIKPILVSVPAARWDSFQWCSWTMWPATLIYITAQVLIKFYFSLRLSRHGLPLHSFDFNLTFPYNLHKEVLWLLLSLKTFIKGRKILNLHFLISIIRGKPILAQKNLYWQKAEYIVLL